MGKSYTYLLMASGVMLLFYFMGLIQDTGTSQLLDFLLDTESFSFSGFFDKAKATLSLVAAAGIALGALFARNTELAVVGPLSVYIANLFFDFLSVFSIVKQSNPTLAYLVLSPLIVLWTLVIVELLRGRD